MKPASSHSIPTPEVPKRRLREVREVTDRLAEISELAEKLADEYTMLLKKLATLQKCEDGLSDAEADIDPVSERSFDMEPEAAADGAAGGAEDPHSGILSVFPPEPEGEEEVTGRYSLKGQVDVVRTGRK